MPNTKPYHLKTSKVKPASSTEPAIIHIIDDDQAMCESLTWLLNSMNWKVKTYPSAQNFLEHYDDSILGCAILDVRMPGMSGLELQDILKQRKINIPIIFITGHGDVRMAVRAMKLGAIEFLNKPFNEQELIESINRSLSCARLMRKDQEKKKIIIAQLKKLTTREKEILKYLLQGYLNKVIAHELSLSIKTVELHRSNILRKLKAPSMTALLSMLYQQNVNFETLSLNSHYEVFTEA